MYTCSLCLQYLCQEHNVRACKEVYLILSSHTSVKIEGISHKISDEYLLPSPTFHRASRGMVLLLWWVEMQAEQGCLDCFGREPSAKCGFLREDGKWKKRQRVISVQWNTWSCFSSVDRLAFWSNARRCAIPWKKLCMCLNKLFTFFLSFPLLWRAGEGKKTTQVVVIANIHQPCLPELSQLQKKERYFKMKE